jgi:LysM repeat protein
MRKTTLNGLLVLLLPALLLTTNSCKQQEIPTSDTQIAVDSATIANITKEVNLVTEEEDTTCVDVSPIVTTDTLCSDWVSPQTILETPPQSTPVKHVKDDTAAVVAKPTTSVVKAVKITKPAPKQPETVKVQKKQAAQAVLHIYIIEKGDTFYSIARKLKIDVKKLREFNPGMYKILNPGDEIRYWKTYQ